MSRAISGPHTDGTVCVHFSLTAHPVLNPGTLVLGQLLTAGGNSTEWPVQLGMAGWVLPGPGPRMGGPVRATPGGPLPALLKVLIGSRVGGGAWGLTAAVSGCPAAAALGRGKQITGTWDAFPSALSPASLPPPTVPSLWGRRGTRSLGSLEAWGSGKISLDTRGARGTVTPAGPGLDVSQPACLPPRGSLAPGSLQRYCPGVLRPCVH